MLASLCPVDKVPRKAWVFSCGANIYEVKMGVKNAQLRRFGAERKYYNSVLPPEW
jgi:hypothetical protein